MSNIVGCTLIIKDDFLNVLVFQKKTKKGEPQAWGLVNSKIKGKETIEKSITRGIKDSIKVLAFDLQEVGEHIINSNKNESIMVFSASIKEKPNLEKLFVDYKWISKKNIDDINLEDYEKEILKDYLKDA